MHSQVALDGILFQIARLFSFPINSLPIPISSIIFFSHRRDVCSKPSKPPQDYVKNVDFLVYIFVNMIGNENKTINICLKAGFKISLISITCGKQSCNH